MKPSYIKKKNPSQVLFYESGSFSSVLEKKEEIEEKKPLKHTFVYKFVTQYTLILTCIEKEKKRPPIQT